MGFVLNNKVSQAGDGNGGFLNLNVSSGSPLLNSLVAYWNFNNPSASSWTSDVGNYVITSNTTSDRSIINNGKNGKGLCGGYYFVADDYSGGGRQPYNYRVSPYASSLGFAYTGNPPSVAAIPIPEYYNINTFPALPYYRDNYSINFWVNSFITSQMGIYQTSPVGWDIFNPEINISNNSECGDLVSFYSNKIQYVQSTGTVLNPTNSIRFGNENNGVGAIEAVINTLLDENTWKMITCVVSPIVSGTYTISIYVNGSISSTSSPITYVPYDSNWIACNGDFNYICGFSTQDVINLSNDCANANPSYNWPASVGQPNAGSIWGNKVKQGIPVNGEYPNCSIDEFGYWGRVLSGSDIASLYSAGTGKFYPFV